MMAAVLAADRRPGRPRDERLDAAIVDATLAELGHKGIAGTTMDGIAARAGVSKATIYRRWRSKEELLHFVSGQLSNARQPVDTGEVRADLLTIFQPVVDYLEEAKVARLMPVWIGEAARDDAIRELLRSVAQEQREPALAAITRAVDREELPATVDADALIDLIAGGIVYRHLVLGEHVDGRHVARLVDQALSGLTTRAR